VKLSKKGADFSAWDCHPDSVARSGRGTGDKRYESILADLKGPFGLPDVPFPGPDVDLFGGVSGLDPTDILGGKSAGDLLNIPGEIIAFFQHAGELLFTEAGWIRLGKMLGGVLLILWGLRVLVKQTTGTDPVRVAKKTAEAAAAVAVAK
jgi:hypothetical protein